MPWGADHINAFFNIAEEEDDHVKFLENLTEEGAKILIQDLCVDGAIWTGNNPNNYMMRHRYLTVQSKVWFHFINYRLLPSMHSITIMMDKTCLIHSIIKGRRVHVGQFFIKELLMLQQNK